MFYRSFNMLLALLLAWTASGVLAYSGPVYVNPAAAAASSSAVQVVPTAASGNLVTQTVYGFLDFTTTIGNTVMVFSPQSAPPAEPPKKATTPKPPAIETKPSSSSSTPAPSEFKPSPAVVVSTSVNSGPPKVAESKVGVSSVVEVRVSSAPPAAPAPAAPAPAPVVPSVTFLSSVVEVRTSGPSGPPAQEPGPNNNLLAPPEQQQYDFLSKQPAEIVDETYKVYDIRPSSKVHKLLRSHLPESAPSGSGEAPVVIASRVKVSGPNNAQPTGLISSMGGTVVREGVTTVHETRVIGTYIDGSYTKVLKTTSTIKQDPPPGPPAIRATKSLIILKTAAPSGPAHSLHLDPTPAGGSHVEETAFLSEEDALGTRPLRRSAVAGRNTDFLARLHRSRTPAPLEAEFYDEDNYDLEVSPRPVASSSRKPSSRSRTQQTPRPSFSSRFTNSRYGRPSSELATVSVFTETPKYSTASVTPAGGRKYNRNRSSNPKSSNNGPSGSGTSSESGYTRRGYKPRHVENGGNGNHNNKQQYGTTPAPFNKFKLSRPTGRWQYTTSPKPKVTIRQQAQRPSENADVNPVDEELNALTPPASHTALTSPQPGRGEDSQHPQQHAEERGGPATEPLPAASNHHQGELQAEGAEEHHVQTEPLPTPAAHTIRVEISTPADFSDVYYEIATIKSPYTFQVGNQKNTRFITVTSTFERSLATNEPEILPTEPLTENILASSTAPHFEVNQLPADASVATLPPILLASDVETPPLETVTETFNTTQLLLKTHMLPVVQSAPGGSSTTKMYTLVQSYHVTRFVTATKTLPPAEAFQFLPSRALNEFNTKLDEAGSELHELEVSENDQDQEGEERRILPLDLMGLGDLASVGLEFDVDKLNQQKLKSVSPTPASALETTTSAASPPLSPDQLQQLALLRYLNPLAPAPALTTSKPVFKVETMWESHVIPLWNGLSTVFSTISRPVATVTKTDYEVATVAPTAPVLPGFGPQFTIISTPVVASTMATQTSSKVLKLTFGAKTVYSTLFSTKVVPTVTTTYVTTQVPVQAPVAPFPGYFPGVLPGFPYVG